MRPYNHSNCTDKGFTLVELMIAMAILSIVMLGAIAIFHHLDNTWVSEELKADMQQTARVAIDNMSREMMMMGYGASGMTDGSGGSLDCKILVAEKNALEFVTYVSDPTSTSSTEKYQYRIKYYVNSGQLRKVYRKLLDDPDTGEKHDVLLAENVKKLEFQYFFGDDDIDVLQPYSSLGAYPDEGAKPYADFDDCYVDDSGTMKFAYGLAGNDLDMCQYYQLKRDLIRRIKVLVQIETSRDVPGTGEKKVITLRADVAPRNLFESDVIGDYDAPSTPELPPGNDPNAENGFGPEKMKVRDAGECNKLLVKWMTYYDAEVAKEHPDLYAESDDIDGYILQWGVAEGYWIGFKDVPHTDAFTVASPPETDIEVEAVTKYTDTLGAASYYVQVTPYDRYKNYGEPLLMEPNDPTIAIISSFAGTVNDTSANDPVPDPVTGFKAYTSGFEAYSTARVTLNWDPVNATNVIGYRIYRSETPFTEFPIPEIYQISKEYEFGDGWEGARTDVGGSSFSGTHEYHDGEFVDMSQGIMGCADYYYAICPVTCDPSLVEGPENASRTLENGDPAGVYGETEYAFSGVSPREVTPPSPPYITAKAGWRRVFLNVDWPEDKDYDYTRIFFKSGTNGTECEDCIPPATDEFAIPDKQSGYTTEGVFKDFGTAAASTIIFNDETVDLDDGAYPNLSDSQSYTFLAVAYDLCGNQSERSAYDVTFAAICGDDPCGPPTWPTGVTPRVWVNADTTNKNSDEWDQGLELFLSLMWTDIDKEDEVTGLDFFGYELSRSTSPITDPKGGSGLFSVTVGRWQNNTEDDHINEGETYNYCLQATDCIYKAAEFLDESYQIACTTGPPDSPTTVNYPPSHIRANNITDCVLLENVCPGKLRRYNDPLTDTNTSHYELATTRGEFHNQVLFYLQNTSASPLIVESVRAVWGNPNVMLDSVTFGTTTEDGAETDYPLSAASGVFGDVNRTVNTKASSSVLPSGPIPVTLNFTNLSGIATSSSSMRGQLVTVEFKFSNPSIPADEAHDTYVTGYTTGDAYAGVNPIKLAVTGGPVINYALQDQPEKAFNPFVVYNRDTDSSEPVNYPEVGGKRPVNMLSYVTWPTSEDIESVVIRYAATPTIDYTPPTTSDYSSMVSSSEYETVTMTTSGSYYYYGTIPAPTGNDGRGVWYFLLARTEQGNFARRPSEFDSFYYYQQLEFNKCNETPAAPTALNADNEVNPAGPFLTWSSVTMYESGFDIPIDDYIMYNVYRADGIGDNLTFVLMTTVDGLSYTDGHSFISAVTYAVTAENSCANYTDPYNGPNESDYSDSIYVCPGASTDCNIWVSDTVLFTGQTTFMTVASCKAADSGTQNTGTFRAYNTRDMAINGRQTWNRASIDLIETDGDTGVAEKIALLPTDDIDLASASINDGVIFATDPANDIMVDYLYTDAYFAIMGCATTVITVIVDPCSNVPDAPAGISVSVAANKNMTISWSKVTTNNDTYHSSAQYYTEYAKYEIWYSAAAVPGANPAGVNISDTLIGVVDPALAGGTPKFTLNAELGGNSPVVVSTGDTMTVTFSFNNNLSSNTNYSLWMYATDTCAELDHGKSISSSVFTFTR